MGGVTDENRRTVSVALDFLDPEKSYVATLYADAPDADYRTNPEAYEIRTGRVSSRTTLDITMACGGGFALSIREATADDGRMKRLK